ncbi:MAG TPA: hypothetical protein VEL11_00755 [Candidatus Bathyarchaeia archaeon]|nr:hypothetical protein [Candidatus Bathyarchaeia archaeon]HYA83541.1 hypothetical protein [Candidatus Bathyarchaeia archaeon]
MNTKTSVVFSIIAVAAAVLLFAAGPIVSTHQALAWGGGFGGWGGFGGCCGCFSCCGCCGGFGGWGGW